MATRRVRRGLPRIGTLRGVEARAKLRRANHVERSPKGGSGYQYQRPPGSMNPRKVGR